MLKNFRTYNLAAELYRLCVELKLEKHLMEQLKRASLSVVLNLAEGSAKPTAKDRAKFYAIAFGSLRETQAILELGNTEAELKAKADNVAAHLYRLCRA